MILREETIYYFYAVVASGGVCLRKPIRFGGICFLCGVPKTVQKRPRPRSARCTATRPIRAAVGPVAPRDVPAKYFGSFYENKNFLFLSPAAGFLNTPTTRRLHPVHFFATPRPYYYYLRADSHATGGQRNERESERVLDRYGPRTTVARYFARKFGTDRRFVLHVCIAPERRYTARRIIENRINTTPDVFIFFALSFLLSFT